MKQQLNEVNRMRQLAGIQNFSFLKENDEINEESIDENIEEGYGEDTMEEGKEVGSITLWFREGKRSLAELEKAKQILSQNGIEFEQIADYSLDLTTSDKDQIRDILAPQGVTKYVFMTQVGDEEEINEMAKIKDELKSAIEKVIADNPDLDRLPLKKAIRSDQAVLDALGPDDEIYDNQLNKFIALSKGDREVGQRGRKASAASVAKQDVAASEPESKIKIVPSSSSPSEEGEIDNEIGADSPSSKEDVGSANSFKNIIAKKVAKIENMDAGERASSPDMTALKQFIKKPEVSKTLGAETIRGLVSSIIG